MMASQDQSMTQRPSKRRRIALACNTCRARKSKCNGDRPICAACNQFNFECQYEPSDSSTNVIIRQHYLSGLEQRIKDVEHLLRRHDDLLKGHLSACTPTAAGKNARRDNILSSRRSAEAVAHVEDTLNGRDFGQDNPPRTSHLNASWVEDSASDGAEADALAMKFVDEPMTSYFGESSNLTFVHLIMTSASLLWNVDPQPEASSTDRNVKQRSRAKRKRGQDAKPGCEDYISLPVSESEASLYTLPTVEEMEELIDLYFDVRGLLFPFFHKPSFYKKYSGFKASGFTEVSRTWLGVLNMVFATASSTGRKYADDVNGAKRVEASHVFYQRAVALCSEPSKRIVSIDIVHYFLLAVLYLQGTRWSTQTWRLHGLLVRTAIALGLHSDLSGTQLDSIQQEIRCRTWHSIYCLDQVLSVTFGRPPAIPQSQMRVRLPAPWSDEDKEGGDTTMDRADNHEEDECEEEQFNAGFLGVSVRLYQIMGQSLEEQYDNNLGGRPADTDCIAMIQTVGSMRQRLYSWKAILPSYLRLFIDVKSSPGLSHVSKYNRLRTTLTLRYHNLNMMIHRPLICAALRYLTQPRRTAETNHSLTSATDTDKKELRPHTVRLAMLEAHECFLSAEMTIDIIDIILGNSSSIRDNLGVWFFTIYYAFTASLVISGRILWAKYSDESDAEGVISSGRGCLMKAAEAISRLDTENHLVRQCTAHIRYLAEIQSDRPMPSTYPENHNDSSNTGTSTLESGGSEPPGPALSNNGGVFDDISYLYGTEDIFACISKELMDAALSEELAPFYEGQ